MFPPLASFSVLTGSVCHTPINGLECVVVTVAFSVSSYRYPLPIQPTVNCVAWPAAVTVTSYKRPTSATCVSASVSVSVVSVFNLKTFSCHLREVQRLDAVALLTLLRFLSFSACSALLAVLFVVIVQKLSHSHAHKHRERETHTKHLWK